jgi:hypothetical protein
VRSQEEPRLRRAYAIPSLVVLRFANPYKGVVVNDKFLKVCLYENMFKEGLRLPFHPLATFWITKKHFM